MGGRGKYPLPPRTVERVGDDHRCGHWSAGDPAHRRHVRVSALPFIPSMPHPEGLGPGRAAQRKGVSVNICRVMRDEEHPALGVASDSRQPTEEAGRSPHRRAARASSTEASSHPAVLAACLLSLWGQISPEPFLEGSPDWGESLYHRRTNGVWDDVAISDSTEKGTLRMDCQSFSLFAFC